MQTITTKDGARNGVMFKTALDACTFRLSMGRTREQSRGDIDRFNTFARYFMDSGQVLRGYRREAKLYAREETAIMRDPKQALVTEVIVAGAIHYLPSAEIDTLRERGFFEVRARTRRVVDVITTFSIVYAFLNLDKFLPKSIIDSGRWVSAAVVTAAVTAICLISLAIDRMIHKRNMRDLQNARAELEREHAVQGTETRC